MIQNDSCIICGSSENLDTELVITVDDEKVTVKACKEHADDITPKIAKAAYIKWKSSRDAEMKEFLEKAAKLGMTVVPQGGLVTVVSAPKAEAAPKPIAPPTELQGSRKDGILPTSEVDDIMQNRVTGLSGSGAEHHEAYKPNSLAEQLPEGATEGLVKMELAEGRHGTPLAIPAIRQDGLGTTRVRISRSMTDADLQKRFKQQAVDDHSFVKGYDLHRCPVCRGEGQISKSQTETVVCPKCAGGGFV
jgi:hypothetical protein